MAVQALNTRLNVSLVTVANWLLRCGQETRPGNEDGNDRGSDDDQQDEQEPTNCPLRPRG